jgi:eukaryotic-like serine/threonine-protein kinase
MMPLTTGSVLHDRYRIDAPLGQGGMGAVYRAWDLSPDRPAALKVNQSFEAGSRDQFEREARTLAHLRHANLPAILDHCVFEHGFLVESRSGIWLYYSTGEWERRF